MKLKDIPGIGKPAPGFSERRGKNNSFFQTLKTFLELVPLHLISIKERKKKWVQSDRP